jgi:hypothetical protein
LLNRGEIDPTLLTADTSLQRRTQSQPLLELKALNVKRRKGLAQRPPQCRLIEPVPQPAVSEQIPAPKGHPIRQRLVDGAFEFQKLDHRHRNQQFLHIFGSKSATGLLEAPECPTAKVEYSFFAWL